jgi:predicted unusual protein kinase regulating ubiquinone biosynthesis (AarF/ABC1/UbiB family)
VFNAFVGDGMIHSDIHLGNAVVQDLPSGELGLVLFDVGQWERIGLADTTALLWVLSAISNQQRRMALRDVALTSLTGVSALAVESDAPRAGELRKRLELAFSECIAAFEDGTFPDQRQAYFLFLRACERHGVSLPKGAFAVAKMIDSITSQSAQFKLKDVVEDSVEHFLRKNMTWTDAASILRGSIQASLPTLR